MERLTDQFDATSDDGDVFTVHEYTEFTTFRPLSGPPTQVPGMRRLVLDDGRPVTRLDDPGAFKIFGTNKVIRKL